jgi:hypothetical protein
VYFSLPFLLIYDVAAAVTISELRGRVYDLATNHFERFIAFNRCSGG